MWRVRIEVVCESKSPSYTGFPGGDDEPEVVFEHLSDAIAFLKKVEAVTPGDALAGYPEAVLREGRAMRQVLEKWGSKKPVTVESEVRRALQPVVKRNPRVRSTRGRVPGVGPKSPVNCDGAPAPPAGVVKP